MRIIALSLLLPAVAIGQTLPLRLPSFADPPEQNGANPITYPHGILYNPTRLCVQGTAGTGWECLAKSSEVAVVQDSLDDATAALSASLTSVSGVASSAATAASAAQSTASSAATAAANAATAASAAQTTANGAATAASSAQSTANAAQSAATSAGTAAANAQTTANAAQSAATTNATAIASLVARVATAEGQVAALQAQVAALEALPKRLCTTATLTGLSIPLTGGLSSTQNVSLPGVPVGSTCTVAGSSRPPAGATGSPVVTTAGVVNVAFVGGGGLLSGVLAIPNGTYRVCCDS